MESHNIRIKQAFMWNINNVWSGGEQCLRENRYAIFTRLKINCHRVVELRTSVIGKNITVLCGNCSFIREWINVCGGRLTIIAQISFFPHRQISIFCCHTYDHRRLSFVQRDSVFFMHTQWNELSCFHSMMFLHKYLHSTGVSPSPFHCVLFSKQHARDAANKFANFRTKLRKKWAFRGCF